MMNWNKIEDYKYIRTCKIGDVECELKEYNDIKWWECKFKFILLGNKYLEIDENIYGYNVDVENVEEVLDYIEKWLNYMVWLIRDECNNHLETNPPLRYKN